MTHQSKCDVCGQPATIHETSIESSGDIVVRHHCQEHGASVLHGALRIDDPDTQATLANLAEWYNGLTESEKNRIQLEHRLLRRCRDE
jgi:hypothetical protein